MPRALIPLVLTALAVGTLAGPEPPVDYGGGGGFASNLIKSVGKGVKYAGPIVYTNEKPPIIHFPPPPKGGGIMNREFGGGWGKSRNSIKYIPLPHHDLPVLIYQSDFNPPIHVVSPPKGAFYPNDNSIKGEYGPPKGSFASALTKEYGPPKFEYVTPVQDTYGASSNKVESSPPKKIDYGVVQPASSSHSLVDLETSSSSVSSSFVPSTSIGSSKGSSSSYSTPSKSQSDFYGTSQGSSSSQSTQSASFGANSFGSSPSKSPSDSYASPKGLSSTYNSPSASFGSNSYSPPSKPQFNSFGPPPSFGATSDSYGPPKNEYEYGAPPGYSDPKVNYGPPVHVSSEWKQGPPPRSNYRNRGPPKSNYGPPPKYNYGPPKKTAQPLPHIMYSGHPPIHIFHQMPMFLQTGGKDAYGGPPSTSYGSFQSDGGSPLSSFYSPPNGNSLLTESSSYRPQKLVYGSPKARAFPHDNSYRAPQSFPYGAPQDNPTSFYRGSQYGSPQPGSLVSSYGAIKSDSFGSASSNRPSFAQYNSISSPPPGPPKSDLFSSASSIRPSFAQFNSGSSPPSGPPKSDLFSSGSSFRPSFVQFNSGSSPPPGPPKSDLFSSGSFNRLPMVNSFTPSYYGQPQGDLFSSASSIRPSSFAQFNSIPPSDGQSKGNLNSGSDSQKVNSFGPPPSYNSPPQGDLFSFGSEKRPMFTENSFFATSFGPAKGDSFGSASSHGPPSASSTSVWSFGPPKGTSYGSTSSRGPPRGGGGGNGFISSMLSNFGVSSYYGGDSIESASSSSSVSYAPPQYDYGPPKGYGHGPPPKSKAQFAIAPKAWHKPPIIIYAGIKPPVHVYQKPDGGYSSVGNSFGTVKSAGSHSSPHVAADSVDLTYGNSGNSKSESYIGSASEQKPTIMKPPAMKPPTYSTIYVSGVNTPENGQYKTYLVTNNDPMTIQPLGYTSGPSSTTGNIISNSLAQTQLTSSSNIIPSVNQLQSQLKPPANSNPIIESAELLHHHKLQSQLTQFAQARILSTEDNNSGSSQISSQAASEPPSLSVLTAEVPVTPSSSTSSEESGNSPINIPLSLIFPDSVETVSSISNSLSSSTTTRRTTTLSQAEVSSSSSTNST